MFLDTSGLLNLAAANEPHHVRATELYAASTTAVTHSYVVSEFVSLANARKVPREKSLAFILGLLASDNVTTVWVTEGLTRQGFDLLQA